MAFGIKPDYNLFMTSWVEGVSGVWKEFKKFISRGSVIDLAVGIIIGGAFQVIVRSLVDDILMPILGLFTGGIDLSNLFINISGESYATLAEAKAAGAATINIGLFINAIINFIILAFVIFLIIRAINKMRDRLKKKRLRLHQQPRPVLSVTHRFLSMQ